MFGPKLIRDRLDYITILDGISLASSLSARNVGGTLDQDPSFNSHIKAVSQCTCFSLWKITE